MPWAFVIGAAMKENQYVVIQAFMLNELKLKGNELIVYAVIHGYTQDGSHWYYGTRKSLAEWCGATTMTVSNCLKSLMDKGYIIRREVDLGGYVQVQYQVNLTPLKNFEGVGVKNLDAPLKKSLGNDNKEDIKRDNNIVSGIVDYLNEKSGKSYRASSEKTKAVINARIREGFTLDDFKRVIDSKCEEWKNTDMERYIRPETLFGTKFEGYLQTAPKRKEREQVVMPETLPCPKCGGESRHTVGKMYFCDNCNAGWSAR